MIGTRTAVKVRERSSLTSVLLFPPIYPSPAPQSELRMDGEWTVLLHFSMPVKICQYVALLHGIYAI